MTSRCCARPFLKGDLHLRVGFVLVRILPHAHAFLPARGVDRPLSLIWEQDADNYMGIAAVVRHQGGLRR